MFIEKYCNPGQIINLDHVASMNWDVELSVEFLMANGQTVVWKYDNEEQHSEDLDKMSQLLHEMGLLVSVELDME